MARYTGQTTARTQHTTAERARRLLAGVGISREDSDDELGAEDYPWEWIYEGGAPSESGSSNKENEPGRRSISQDGDDNRSTIADAAVTKKRSARNTNRRPTARIIGARMGTFECRLGDTVLLKAEGTNEAWVGLICDFEENDEEDEKMANIMWFSTEKEIRNKQKKRMDFLHVNAPCLATLAFCTNVC